MIQNLDTENIFSRNELLYGKELMARLAEIKVIIFGIGGVGSWCAEGLIRSGIKHLSIVDYDVVNSSNINRQLMATQDSLGKIKVEALKGRLLSINPEAEIVAINKRYCQENNEDFELEQFDYIIDAIDSLKDKISLILNATQTRGGFFSSMGAALKIDPQKIKVGSFGKLKGCPLAAALRKRLRQSKQWPKREFLCVYDEELLENAGSDYCSEMYGNDLVDKKANRVNGTSVNITAIFGFTLSGLILKDLYDISKT